ncbi:MAG: discoidin domain-containing protein [Spirochaetes bacterium]|nr:discoidin domain-containing protein [Spirochaetota bacterium]
MPLLVAFLIAAAAVVGVSFVPAAKHGGGDRLLSGPKSVEVPPGLQNPAYPASLTVNGSIAYNNKFSPDPYADLHYPFSIVYDLHFIHWLGRVDLYNNGPGNSLRQVRLWVSEDGRAWIPTGAAATLRDQPYWERLLFPEVRARWVRLEIWSAYGSLPEFRQIAFYSSRPLPKGEGGAVRPLVDGPGGGDAVLVATITPTLGREKVRAEVLPQSNGAYFYESERVEILPGKLPPGRYLFSFLFEESQAIPRTMRFRGAAMGDEVFQVPGVSRTYKTFRVQVPEGETAARYSLETVEGPNAFFSALWIYRRAERAPVETRVRTVEAWPLAPATWGDLATNLPLLADADRLREEGVSLFHDAASWYLDFRIPPGERAGGKPRFETLEFFFHDGAERRAGFGPETIHLSVTPLDRGDGKPMVALVPHLGGAWADPVSNLLDDPRTPGFDGRVDQGRLLLKWPRLSAARVEGALLNLFVNAPGRVDAWFLASRSTSPLDWSAVRPFPFRETGLWVTNRMIPGLSYDLIVRDPFASGTNLTVRVTERGRSRSLDLALVRAGARTWRAPFTPALRERAEAGERIRFDYGGKSALVDLLTGDDAVLLLLGKDGVSREGAAWTEGERLEFRVRDRDFAEGLSNRSELDLTWESGRLTRRETLPLERIAGVSGERRLLLTLPAVTNVDSQAGAYRLTAAYHDLVGGSGFQERLVEKTISVREKIARVAVKPGLWTPLGALGAETVGVRLGARSVEVRISGAAYPERQEALMTGTEGWLLFLNEEPDRRDALERWLYRRTFQLIPGGLETTNWATNRVLATNWETNIVAVLAVKTQWVEVPQWVAEWTARRTPVTGWVLSSNAAPAQEGPGSNQPGTAGSSNEPAPWRVSSNLQTNGFDSELVPGGHWATNRASFPFRESFLATNLVPRIAAVEILRPIVRREPLLRTLGGPETGRVRVEAGADGKSFVITADLVRPLGSGLLFNAMRYGADGSQRFLVEPILGDPFRGLMLEAE